MLNTIFVLGSAALRDRKGVSSLEYVVLAVAVIAAVGAAATQFSSGLSTAFAAIFTELSAHD